jgi:TIR domain
MTTKRGSRRLGGRHNTVNQNSTPAGYEYDVFISYRRAGNVEHWVQDHLHPVLTECLTDHLGHPPRIFIDTGISCGDWWPRGLVDALNRTRLLLPVLTAGYFDSPWCHAEWATFAARERWCGKTAHLIHPILYSGLRSLSPTACERQLADFQEWRFPYPQFRLDPRYLAFHNAVDAIAETIVQQRRIAPSWSPRFPVRTPASPRSRTGLANSPQ